MNARERFRETAHFGEPDRVPLGGFGPRKATFERWRSEGMPADVDPRDYFGYWFDEKVVMTTCPSPGIEWCPSPCAINIGPVPHFKPRLLEQNERYRVWMDTLGIKQRGFREEWEDGWSGFATRQWLEHPVKTRQDFSKIKKRYDPKSLERYPKNWSKQLWEQRDYVLSIWLSGPFDWTRNIMGFHQMIKYFFTGREFMHEVMDFWAEFHIETLHKGLDEVEVDSAVIAEDVCYKTGPMISPKMVREFMQPAYREIARFLRNHGVDAIFLDTDGNADLLIPILLEAGINGITPCEQCHRDMNPVVLREKYPRLVIDGGIDKRELAKDRRAIESEVMSKVPHMIERGGYFPGVDHGVPPDVSLENFRYFLKLVRKICEKAD